MKVIDEMLKNLQLGPTGGEADAWGGLVILIFWITCIFLVYLLYYFMRKYIENEGEI
jgi:hypothetical protein